MIKNQKQQLHICQVPASGDPLLPWPISLGLSAEPNTSVQVATAINEYTFSYSDFVTEEFIFKKGEELSFSME